LILDYECNVKANKKSKDDEVNKNHQHIAHNFIGYNKVEFDYLTSTTLRLAVSKISNELLFDMPTFFKNPFRISPNGNIVDNNNLQN